MPNPSATSPTGRHRVVVIGGGTGAPVSIRAALANGSEVSAVVAMADDGGSSGLLREAANTLPPGDIRKCLVSMAADPGSPWAQAFASRLAYDHGHPLGNLILATLADVTGSLPEAIRLSAELLQARGHVYPSTLDDIELIGWTSDGRSLEGQAMLTHSDKALASVALRPESPQAYAQALAAISQADLIVLGPGSLFTSIISNLLVPGILAAVIENPAPKLFLCSLADMQGETRGMDAVGHVKALLGHGMAGHLDMAVMHVPSQPHDGMSQSRPVAIDAAGAEAIQALGVMPVMRHLVDPIRPTWHDVETLASLFNELASVQVGRSLNGVA